MWNNTKLEALAKEKLDAETEMLSLKTRLLNYI